MNRTTVLLVDDEEEFLASTGKVLQRRDFKVITASSGREALDVLGRQKVDVVVIDMKMPGMDGEAVFEEIRQIWPGLPVIVLTGHDSVTQAFEMTKRGVFDYLLKPCEIDNLSAKIREAAAQFRNIGDASSGGAAHRLNAEERVKVLLVDDEEQLLHALQKVLARRNMDVHIARSGKEALTFLDDNPVDVVVLDVKMPGMDGLEVLWYLKADPIKWEVILLTGHPTLDSAVQGMRKGAFDYMVKPPDVETLIRLIRMAHRKRKAALVEEQQQKIEDILRRYPD